MGDDSSIIHQIQKLFPCSFVELRCPPSLTLCSTPIEIITILQFSVWIY